MAGVRKVRLVDRQGLLELVPEEHAPEGAFARAHLVDVPAKGVDLAVVRHEAQGLGAVPGREGVRREAGVHHREVRGVVGIGKVGEVGDELVGREHSLVDHDPAREAGDVEVAVGVVLFSAEKVGRLLADHEELAVESFRGQRGEAAARGARRADEKHFHRGLAREGGGPKPGVVHGDAAPPEHQLARLLDDPLDRALARVAPRLVDGEEDDAGGVVPLGG